MKVAFYGRYSSDHQRDASIEDQHRVVQRWAETHQHELVASSPTLPSPVPISGS